jgi:microcystin-dependent protein
MGTPYMGEIKMVAWGSGFGPKGWAECNGQFLPINQNQALFSLFGTSYGGNGQTTFALPDLRGRVPIHFGDGFTLGQVGGQAAHTVTQAEMAAHNHMVNAIAGAATTGVAVGNFWANQASAPFSDTPNGTMNPANITNVGGSQAHENRQPYLVIRFIVSLQGVFPSRP